MSNSHLRFFQCVCTHQSLGNSVTITIFALKWKTMQRILSTTETKLQISDTGGSSIQRPDLMSHNLT